LAQESTIYSILSLVAHLCWFSSMPCHDARGLLFLAACLSPCVEALLASERSRGSAPLTPESGEALALLSSRAALRYGLAALVSDVRGGCLQDSAPLAASSNGSNADGVTLKLLESVKESDSQSLKWQRWRRPIFWVHLHNFAGTYICQEAHKQQENIPPEPSNWLGCLMPNDGCSAERPSRWGCFERIEAGFTFTMAERDVDDDDLCPAALKGVMLRDPVLAAESTLRANYFDKVKLMQVLNEQRLEDGDSVDHTECLPAWDSYQHFDNFATRSLGNGYQAPVGQVTREHLELAKQRLLQMDVVVILEELVDHLPQFQSVFEWDVSEMTPSQPAAKNHDCKPNAVSWTEEEKEMLTTLNALDYELLEFGRKVAADLSNAARHQLTLK